MNISRPNTSRRGAIDFRSLDKIESIIVRECEKSKKVNERKQYFKCRVVSKSRNKDGVPYVKVCYDGWGREYDGWRPISELTGMSNEDETDEEGRNFVVRLEVDRIRVKVQKSLTGLRRRDKIVVIREPVSEKIWRAISCACRAKKSSKKKSTLYSLPGASWSEDTLTARTTLLRL